MAGGVYQIRNLVTNDRYVGSAVDFARRRRDHFALLRRGRHHSVHLQRAYDKYGEAAFTFEVLAECDAKFALAAEQNLLTAQAGSYNIARDACAPMSGRKHTPATREKIRRARTGAARPAHSAALREKFQHPEYRARFSAAQRGRPKSPEHAQKLVAQLVAARRERSRVLRMHRALHYGMAEQWRYAV